MLQYVNISVLLDAIQENATELNDEELAAWIRGINLQPSVIDLIEDEVGEADFLVDNKLSILTDLIESLSKFEQEHRDLQIVKFKQLELLRHASDTALKIRNGAFMSNGLITDTNLDTKECGHPPCGKIFIADPPSKMYCSEKCREKAKKWRKRHGNE